MKTKILWSLLILGFASGIYGAEEKQPQKQEAPAVPAVSANGQQTHHALDIPPEGKDRKNPIRFTEVSVDHGKKLFQTQCVLCHGIKADGNGDFARVYGVHPPDFTNPEVLGKRTDGELFYIIGAGSEKMPGKHMQMTEKQRWDLVNYLRAVEGRKPSKTMSAK
jgi:mono/diheme cytochrome c family protein